MRRAAGLAEVAHLVVECLPVAGEDMFAGDDDVDLGRTVSDRGFDLAQLHVMRDKARGETGGDGGNRNAGSGQRLRRGGDEAMIDADSAGMESAIAHAQAFENVRPHGMNGLGAEPLDATRRIVAAQRGEVDAGHGLEQPGGLGILLHRAAARKRCDAALCSGEIDAQAIDPVTVEGKARVAHVMGQGNDVGLSHDRN